MERARQTGFDSILCCGDIVGYGPEPNEAVEFIRAERVLTIRGNHDRVASGEDDPTDFNLHAARAAMWTREALTEENRAYLRNLPVGPLDVGNDAQLVHGAVTDEDDYIMCPDDAAESFALTNTGLTFFGHTHFQCVYARGPLGGVTPQALEGLNGMGILRIRRDVQYLVNPGSVGQPRDNDTRAGFAIWDTDASRVEFYRVEYPLEITQDKMRLVDLPTYLVERLSQGR